MDFIYREIRQLGNIRGLSKNDQLVRGVLNVIQKRELRKGDRLPSVNDLIKEVGFARETIAKGYRELIRRGIVESHNRIGYYIIEEDIRQHLRIALVLFAFDTIQETFYKTFRSRLNDETHIDFYFHHNNMQVFENIIFSINGRYGIYVVAPIPNEKTASVLKALPMDRFLMIDRFEPMKGDFSYVAQEFEQNSYKVFEQLKTRICKYRNGIVYYHRPHSDTPIEILNAFKRFVTVHKIKYRIHEEYLSGSLEKDCAYFTINNAELWMMLKDARNKGFLLGKDVGILSHNDDIVKEIICGGITTYSADFTSMGELAAQFILTREKVQEIVPISLIDRKSI